MEQGLARAVGVRKSENQLVSSRHSPGGSATLRSMGVEGSEGSQKIENAYS